MPNLVKAALVVPLSLAGLLFVHLFALSVQDAVNCLHGIEVCN